MARRASQIVLDTYGIGLMASEMGECGQCLGNALRFGLDTPERGVASSRERIADEAGDVLAAIDWAAEAGVIDWNRVAASRLAKLAKLRDPMSKNNEGLPLAPNLSGSR